MDILWKDCIEGLSIKVTAGHHRGEWKTNNKNVAVAASAQSHIRIRCSSMFLKRQISKCLRLSLGINSEWFGIGLKQKSKKQLSISGFELATFGIRGLHPSTIPFHNTLAKPKPT
jgi:hypothetical protein